MSETSKQLIPTTLPFNAREHQTAVMIARTVEAVNDTTDGVSMSPQDGVPEAEKQDCFDFLALPKELRLDVYDQLEVVNRYHYRDPWFLLNGKRREDGSDRACILVEKVQPWSLVQTCHKICDEVLPVLQRAAASVRPPQMICRVYDDMARDACASSLLLCILRGAFIMEDTSRYYDDSLAKLERSYAGKSFIRQAFTAMEHGHPPELALYVDTGVDMGHFVNHSLPQILWRDFDDRASFSIILAIQGLIVPPEHEAMFRHICHRAANYSMVSIQGVEGTPAVDWKGHWGVADLGSLSWT